MKVDSKQLIQVTVTKSPVRKSYDIEWETLKMTPETLLNNYILYGYNWSNVYRDLSSFFTKDTFIGSHCVVIDSYNDKTRREMAEWFKSPNFLKPTFGYTHPDKDSIKLVYCFDERLTPSAFPIIYDNVWKRAGITQDSNHRAGCAMIQKNKGNCTSNIKCSISNCIYSIEDFCENPTESIPFYF